MDDYKLRCMRLEEMMGQACRCARDALHALEGGETSTAMDLIEQAANWSDIDYKEDKTWKGSERR